MLENWLKALLFGVGRVGSTPTGILEILEIRLSRCICLSEGKWTFFSLSRNLRKPFYSLVHFPRVRLYEYVTSAVLIEDGNINDNPWPSTVGT